MVQTLTGELGTAVVDGNDRRYRYHLTRDFGEGEGSVAFIMFNPSTANHHCDDDTVARCSDFARDQGWRVLEVGNLYARYATNPADLRGEPDPKGPHNDAYLRCIATRCSTVVAAWGVQGTKFLTGLQFKDRANHVLRLIWKAMENAGREPMIHHLGALTQAGYPPHPSRLRNSAMELDRWNGNAQPQIR